MVAFALSCFGILLYLWLSFGGAVPLQAEGLPGDGRVPGGHPARPGGRRAHLRRTVGKVKKTSLDKQTGADRRVIEIDAAVRAAARRTPRDPAPEDAARRDLRGAVARARAAAPRRSRDGGHAAARARCRRHGGARRDPPGVRPGDAARVPDLDGPAGRRRCAAAAATQRRARQPRRRSPRTPTKVLAVLNHQQGRPRALVRNTGEVFDALTERQGQLRA